MLLKIDIKSAALANQKIRVVVFGRQPTNDPIHKFLFRQNQKLFSDSLYLHGFIKSKDLNIRIRLAYLETLQVTFKTKFSKDVAS